MVFCGRAVELLAGRLTTACSCRDPAGSVLQNGVVGATLGSGRLRAPGPAGLRQRGGVSQLTLSPLARLRPMLQKLVGTGSGETHQIANLPDGELEFRAQALTRLAPHVGCSPCSLVGSLLGLG